MFSSYTGYLLFFEEIVGNIMDEYDEDSVNIEERGKNEYVIEGKTPLEELEERFGIPFEG